MLFASSVAVTHRTLGTLDLVIIGIYFAIVFGIGFYFSKKERTSEDYFLASRNIGWFAIGASLFVSNISTEHFIGLAGSGATSGLAVGHFEWLACLMLLLLGWVFVPFYLRSNVFTMPEFPGTPLQSQLRHLPCNDFRDCLYLYENLRASVCRGDCSGACGGLEPLDRRGHSGCGTGIYTIAGDWPR